MPCLYVTGTEGSVGFNFISESTVVDVIIGIPEAELTVVDAFSFSAK